MLQTSPPLSAPRPGRRPLGDRIILIIVLLLASALAATGMTTAGVLELLAGAGIIALRLTSARPTTLQIAC
ncbi:hypothetical protein [Streptomyces sp. NPDC101150]|uniref:hypothetical protein n=1 Tax=Streptomyces sp. NPDC101150 TaxID=3366114 RepID=UPI003828C3CF